MLAIGFIWLLSLHTCFCCFFLTQVCPIVASFCVPAPAVPFMDSFKTAWVTVEDLEEFYRVQQVDMCRQYETRPYAWSNTVSTLDGVTSFKEVGSTISQLALHNITSTTYPIIKDISLADFRILQAGWAMADAILISDQNLRDEPNTTCTLVFDDLVKWRRKKGLDELPIRLILSATGDVFPKIGSELYLSDFFQIQHPIHIFTTEQGHITLTRQLQKFQYPMDHVFIHVFPSVSQQGVQLQDVFYFLRTQLNIKYLDVTTGGTVLQQLRTLKLMDELRYTLSPMIIGHTNSQHQLRPHMFPFNGVSFNSINSPLIKWLGMRVLDQRLVFFRGVYEYRHY